MSRTVDTAAPCRAYLQSSYEYVSRLDLSGRNDTPCARELVALRRDMEAAPNFERPWNATARSYVANCHLYTIGGNWRPNFRPVL